MRRALRSLALSLAIAGVAACGGGQTRGTPFDPGWQDDHGAAMAAFARTFGGARVHAGADVAVGVVGNKALVGIALDGGSTWRFEHELHGRPAVAGSVVVAAGGGELFALDARTGSLLWSRASGGRIRGAGDDGTTTVVSLIPTTGLGSLVLAIARDGSIVRQIEDEAAIGVPAIAGDSVFLPWQGRFLSVYDLPSGEERARVDLHAHTSRVFVVGGALYAGEVSATRFDERIAQAEGRGATTIRLPKPMGGMPGDPLWMRPGTDWVNREADALDKVRLYARPAAQGAAVFGDRFAATYFRVALGFDAKTGAIAWAHAHDADLLGGAAYAGGFALCDAKGSVTFLDGKSGAVTGQIALGQPVDACLVQADAFVPKAAAAATRGLADQLAEIVLVPEAELTTLQQALLRELARLDDERATKALLDLASSDRTAPPLLADARAALAARRTGASFMLEALARRYDHLAGVRRAPPVGPLADALATIGEKRAAPLLAAHLGDPVSTSDDVKRAAAALVTLAGPSEAPAIEAFFAHYRAVEAPEVDEAVQAAVVSAAEALLRLGVRDPVAAAVSDPITRPALKEKLVALFAPKAAGGAGPTKGK
ncbi:MAG: PQQ-binding-like beta-propeller repeat protein [Minicystis sp.]